MNASANCLFVPPALTRVSLFGSMAPHLPREVIVNDAGTVESNRSEEAAETESVEDCEYSVWDCF
ncbi:MAG: hypothetical protein R3F07_05040 [Opitutaceae bacterium]